ncbi:hypothetical protein GALL_507500 [mine drainage metagenome]|uniref:Uncharacterized protein n=1 Tax=mine drainage metagenome TaxID=410659 RepID=A0A1J5PJE4_9ZZZZ
MQGGGIEHRNDEDCAHVVENGEGEQEDLERGRHAFADQCQHAHRKGDVGSRRNRPTLRGVRVAAVERRVDQRGHRHAPKRGHTGKHHIARVLELALQHLSLQFQPDQEEEHRHQPVVDPKDQRFRQPLAINQHGDFDVEQVFIGGGKRRVCHDHRQRRRDQQQDAACRLVLEKAVEPAG